LFKNIEITLQYVIDTHHLIDVDVHLMSSYIVLPQGGVFNETCACTVANLGSISVKSNPISAQTRTLKDMSLKDLTDAFKSSLRDQVYDKFNVSLENMQVTSSFLSIFPFRIAAHLPLSSTSLTPNST
jgi:vacuolar protein sorting-associated protein 13A/C